MTTTLKSPSPTTTHDRLRVSLRRRWRLTANRPQTLTSILDLRDARDLPRARLAQEWRIR